MIHLTIFSSSPRISVRTFSIQICDSPKMTEPEVCKFEFDFVRIRTLATEDQNIARIDILVPSIFGQRSRS